MPLAASPALTAPDLHIASCGPRDVAALAPLLALQPVPREQPGSPCCSYLDRCIVKPWGSEERIYDDAISEAWLLELDAMRRTSMHAHLRKTTLLICIEGSGQLLTTADVPIALVPGVAVLIMPGALHCSSTPTGMRLVEFESPKDKYDLVRLEDPTRSPGVGYEGEDAACHPAAGSAALVAIEDGPPLTRLRGSGADGTVQFRLRTGVELKARGATFSAAIAVELDTVLRREFCVLRADSAGRATDDDLYLTISSRTG